MASRREQRKNQVLTQGTPSFARSIADAIVAKDESLFLVTKPDGQIPLRGEHGFGLYFHDCRFLSGYELDFVEAHPEVLVSTAEPGFKALYELTNPELVRPDGRTLDKHQLGFRWERLLDGKNNAMHERIAIRNFGRERAVFTVRLRFRADFEDVYEVRGLLKEEQRRKRAPVSRDGTLRFEYDGRDGVHRFVVIRFWTKAERIAHTTARFELAIDSEQTAELALSVFVAENALDETLLEHPPDARRLEKHSRQSLADWSVGQTRVRSASSLVLERVMRRSLEDLRALRTPMNHATYFAAGVPWFVTLFGRDSIITALETLAYAPHVADQTLRLLAEHQGKKNDRWRDEQPGKILHELRVGELARAGEIPHTPYYGSVDATPLFLILVARAAQWTGRLDVFERLHDHVEAALGWIDASDPEKTDYIRYESTSARGLVNQGWKDSGDAIVNEDGSLVTPPIALVEVQAYTYMAKLEIAELYARAGDRGRAATLRHDAEQLRVRFNRDFWDDEKGIYGLAIGKSGNVARVVSSNPGHALWAGIADPEKAKRCVAALMSRDMFTGWGIRTLSAVERRYNPIAYHLGTVWPHDNAIIAAGFRRYGYDDEASRIFSGLIQAAMLFPQDRLPELFSGFSREDYGVPVHYPVACHPQAWAAGSVPYLLETSLGLVPEAFERRLRIVRPVLPEFVTDVVLEGIRIGTGEVTLEFRRHDDGSVAVEVRSAPHDIDVVVDEQPQSRAA